jgi:hypothetical protein
MLKSAKQHAPKNSATATPSMMKLGITTLSIITVSMMTYYVIENNSL